MDQRGNLSAVRRKFPVTSRNRILTILCSNILYAMFFQIIATTVQTEIISIEIHISLSFTFISERLFEFL
jgi:hypothetical protein